MTELLLSTLFPGALSESHIIAENPCAQQLALPFNHEYSQGDFKACGVEKSIAWLMEINEEWPMTDIVKNNCEKNEACGRLGAV